MDKFFNWTPQAHWKPYFKNQYTGIVFVDDHVVVPESSNDDGIAEPVASAGQDTEGEANNDQEEDIPVEPYTQIKGQINSPQNLHY